MMADYKIGDKVVVTYRVKNELRKMMGKITKIDPHYLRISIGYGCKHSFRWHEIEGIELVSDAELIQKVKDAYLSDDVSIVEWLDVALEDASDEMHEAVRLLSDEQLSEILRWAGSDDWYVKNHETIQTKKYTVSIAVNGRVDIQVEAGSFKEAREKAISCFCDTNYQNMERISFKAVKAEDEDGNMIDY